MVVGWLFEAAYVIGLIAWWAATREKRAQRAAVAANQHANFIASKAVYQTQAGRSQVYRHGLCTINHRTYDTAARCRQG